MEEALENLVNTVTSPATSSFEHLREIVGFPDYYQTEQRYAWADFNDETNNTKTNT